MQPVRRTAVALAGMLLLTATACTSTERAADPSAPPARPAPTLSFDTTGAQCTPYPARFLLYDRVSATTSATLTGISLSHPQQGAKLLGSWTSDVTSQKVPTTGWTLGEGPDPRVHERIGWTTKRPLAGTSITGTSGADTGQRLEIILRLDMPDGSSFDGIDIAWQTADGRTGTAHWDIPTSVGPSCEPRHDDAVIDAGGIRPGVCVDADASGIRLARTFRATRDITLTYDTFGPAGFLVRSWVVPVSDTKVAATTLLDRGAPLPGSDWRHRHAVSDAHLRTGHTYAWIGDLQGDPPVSVHRLGLAWTSSGGRSGIASVPLDLDLVGHQATDC